MPELGVNWDPYAKRHERLSATGFFDALRLRCAQAYGSEESPFLLFPASELAGHYQPFLSGLLAGWSYLKPKDVAIPRPNWRVRPRNLLPADLAVHGVVSPMRQQSRSLACAPEIVTRCDVFLCSARDGRSMGKDFFANFDAVCA